MAVSNLIPANYATITKGTAFSCTITAVGATQVVLSVSDGNDEVIIWGFGGVGAGAWSGFQNGFTGTASTLNGVTTLSNVKNPTGWGFSPLTFIVEETVGGIVTEHTFVYNVYGLSEYPTGVQPYYTGFDKGQYLYELKDVNTAGLADAYVLAWDSATSRWVPRAASTPGAHILDSHSDVTIAGPTNGQVLTYSNGFWVNADAAGGGGSGTVTSVGATGSGGITVSGSPIVDSGVLALGINAAALRTTLGPSGTPGATTYLRGDGTWSVPPSSPGTVGTLDEVLTSGTPDNAVTLDGSHPIALTAGSSTPIFGIVSLNAGDTAITIGSTSVPGEVLQIGNRYVLFPAVDAGGNVNHLIGGATGGSANKLRATEIKGSSNVSSGGGGDVYLRQGTSSSGTHGEIHIGWSTGPSKLQITDSNGSTGTVGQVLTADGAGDATWAAGGGGSIGTLDQVINSGTPDNNVIIPAANPIVFADGGVASVTPLTITRTGTGTSPALIVNQTASTYPILQGTTSIGTVSLTGAGLVWDSGASSVVIGGGTNGGVGGGDLIITAQQQATSGTGGDVFIDGGDGITGAADGDVYIGGFTTGNVRVGKSGTVLHVIDDAGATGTAGQVLAKTAGGQIRWSDQIGAGSVGTLQQVLTTGTPDNDVTIPVANPIVLRDGGVQLTPLQIIATNANSWGIDIQTADPTGVGIGVSDGVASTYVYSKTVLLPVSATSPYGGNPGYGYFWPRTSDGHPMYTSPDGTDYDLSADHTHTLSQITDAGTAAGATLGTGDGQVPVYDGANNLTVATLTATVGANSTEYGEYGIAPYASRTTAYTIGGTPQTGTVVDIAILGMASGANAIKGGKTEIWGGQAQVGVADGGNVSIAGGPGIGGGLAGKVEIGGSDGAVSASEIHLLKGFSVTESADRPVAPGAGKGQLWVRTSDNALVFTTPSDHPVAAYQGVNRHITPFIQAADPVATAVDGDVWIETAA